MLLYFFTEGVPCCSNIKKDLTLPSALLTPHISSLIPQPNLLTTKPCSVDATTLTLFFRDDYYTCSATPRHIFFVQDDEVRLCYLDDLTWKISCIYLGTINSRTIQDLKLTSQLYISGG